MIAILADGSQDSKLSSIYGPKNIGNICMSMAKRCGVQKSKKTLVHTLVYTPEVPRNTRIGFGDVLVRFYGWKFKRVKLVHTLVYTLEVPRNTKNRLRYEILWLEA